VEAEMAAISANKTGLVFGLLVGGGHVLWSLLVALYLAQPVIDFVFWMHFIKPTFVVEAFGIDRAVVLVAVTSVVGYVAGYCFAFLWNRIRKQDTAFSRPA
jgi:hypothetical protein